MSDTAAADLISTLERLGLIDPANVSIEPLTGGVSSDIVKVSSGCRVMAVKRALPNLKVASEWRAPVERNRYEVAWLEVAGRVIPDCVPRVLAHDPASGLFAMSYLDPARYPVWKSQLRDGAVDLSLAAAVGCNIAAVHAATAGDPAVAAEFATDHIFYSIRLEPYLEATALKHPDIADRLMALSRETLATKRALVHGDVSPKNILVGPRGPIFLDAECAWYGDPAFDLAFCLNHLLLKCLWNGPACGSFLRALDVLAGAYLERVDWEPPAAVEGRAARLLPCLFLARIDGKSPVEYITAESDRQLVRAVAVPFIREPAARLADIRDAWAAKLHQEAARSVLKQVRATRITQVRGRRVWDSRGRPTVEAEVHLAGGASGRAIAPAGASTGSGEAVDLRDGGAAFGGFDVRRAIANLNEVIAPALCGLDGIDQAAIDALLVALDGTQNKGKLGGNALIATSMAVLQAAAAAHNMPLWRYLAGGGEVRIPLPQIQIFGGGAHAARRVDIQDFMIVCPAAASFAAALDRTAEVYRAAGLLMAEQGKAQGVADEGGHWPAFASNEDALDTLVRSIERAGFKPGEEVAIALDIAASEFGKAGRYRLALDERELDSDGMIELLGRWIERYPIFSIEDPLAEDDFEGFRRFTRAYGERIQIVGDDFLVTNAARVEEAAASRACNAALIKPNQAGTITETKAALDAARRSGFRTIISARSGETEDVTIAHLAVGWDAGQLKVGSFARSERMAKWNEVLRIEEALGERAPFGLGQR